MLTIHIFHSYLQNSHLYLYVQCTDSICTPIAKSGTGTDVSEPREEKNCIDIVTIRCDVCIMNGYLKQRIVETEKPRGVKCQYTNEMHNIFCFDNNC